MGLLQLFLHKLAVEHVARNCFKTDCAKSGHVDAWCPVLYDRTDTGAAPSCRAWAASQPETDLPCRTLYCQTLRSRHQEVTMHDMRVPATPQEHGKKEECSTYARPIFCYRKPGGSQCWKSAPAAASAEEAQARDPCMFWFLCRRGRSSLCRTEKKQKTTEVMHAGSSFLLQFASPWCPGQEAGIGCHEPGGSNPPSRRPILATPCARRCSRQRPKACQILVVGGESRLIVSGMYNVTVE